MAELRGFDGLFSLEGKVALVTGGMSLKSSNFKHVFPK